MCFGVGCITFSVWRAEGETTSSSRQRARTVPIRGCSQTDPFLELSGRLQQAMRSFHERRRKKPRTSLRGSRKIEQVDAFGVASRIPLLPDLSRVQDSPPSHGTKSANN